jgi:hypothetical protein
MSRTIRRTRVATTLQGYIDLEILKNLHDFEGDEDYDQYARLALIDFHRDKHRLMSRFERYSTGVPRYVRIIDVKRQTRESAVALRKAVERNDFDVVLPLLGKRAYDDFFLYW